MQQRGHTALVLLLSLVCLYLHTQACTATCSPNTCTKYERSWEGARAAAKAAYEKNLELAGLAGQLYAQGKAAAHNKQQQLADLAGRVVAQGKETVHKWSNRSEASAAAAVPGLSATQPAGSTKGTRQTTDNVAAKQQAEPRAASGRHKRQQQRKASKAVSSSVPACTDPQCPLGSTTADIATVPADIGTTPSTANSSVAAESSTGNVVNGSSSVQLQQHSQMPHMWPYLWLLLTHLVAFLLGWLLRGSPFKKHLVPEANQAGVPANESDLQRAAGNTIQLKKASASDPDVTEAGTHVIAAVRFPQTADAPVGEQHEEHNRQCSPAGEVAYDGSDNNSYKEAVGDCRTPGSPFKSQLSDGSTVAEPVATSSALQLACSSSKRGRKWHVHLAGHRRAARKVQRHFASTEKRSDQGRVAAAATEAQQQDSQGLLGMLQLHGAPCSSRNTSAGGRSSRRASTNGSGGATRGTHESIEQLQLQRLPQQQLLAYQQAQRPTTQIIINMNSETVHGVMVPAYKVVKQLAEGVTSLRDMTAPIAHQLGHITSLGTKLTGLVEEVLAWGGRHERQQQLATQQALGQRSGQLGLSVLLVGLAVTAVKVGRLWEVHQVCSAVGHQSSSWSRRMTGTAGFYHAWLYTKCSVQQLGLYAVGLLVLYQVFRASWRGLVGGREGNGPSRAWQLDLVVFRGAVCSLVGIHVVHCLGAAWVPWLVLWLLWVCCQLILQLRQLGNLKSAVMVLVVALVLPLFMAVSPFHARALVLQGRVLEIAPWAQQLLVLHRLLGGPFGRY